MTIYTGPFPPIQCFSESLTMWLSSTPVRSKASLPLPGRHANFRTFHQATGKELTYGALIKAARSFGSGISKILPRDSIAVLFSPNSLHFCPAFFGIIAAGAIVSFASPSATPEELQYQIEDSGAAIVIASSDLRGVAREAARLAGMAEDKIYFLPGTDGVVLTDGASKSYEELIGDESFEPVVFENAAEKIAYLPYSSGTTGRPKGVLISHKNVTSTTQIVRQLPFIAKKEVSICSMPLYHGGLIAPPIALALAKHPVIDKFDLSSLDWIILEAVLLTCPHVLDCAVIGVWSSEKHTEFPRGYVVLHPTSRNIPNITEKVAEYVASKVAHYKRLGAGVVVMDAIPKSPSGKILRKDLRAIVLAEEAAAAKL
ncbi:hypothetical protein P7C70_g8458, partial [Phenoliferia sp. Uapishka_3]